MTKALMLDLETCATDPRAALLQAGWCVFEPADEGVGFTREVNVNVDSCMSRGGVVSDGTIRWWLSQPAPARDSVRVPGTGIENVIAVLVDDFQQQGCTEVWSNGSCFDIVIIEHYMRELGVTPPWKYWQIRDTRTCWALAEAAGWRKPKRATAHTALADCLAQVADVQAAWRWVTQPKVRGEPWTGEGRQLI